jgi:hypothetical protein
MQLGETIATYDVALALRGESGKFDVTSPAGEIYHITCKPNDSITNLQYSGNGANPQPFLIRKVAETVSYSAPDKTVLRGNEPETQPRATKTPFLISSDDTESMEQNVREVVLEVPQTDLAGKPLLDLELLYKDVEPGSPYPNASVCLRGASLPGNGMLVTNVCTSFNEFDVEIRRLHARLDDIRYRARKKFYQTRDIAAGA